MQVGTAAGWFCWPTGGVHTCCRRCLRHAGLSLNGTWVSVCISPHPSPACTTIDFSCGEWFRGRVRSMVGRFARQDWHGRRFLFFLTPFLEGGLHCFAARVVDRLLTTPEARQIVLSCDWGTSITNRLRRLSTLCGFDSSCVAMGRDYFCFV